jgi:SAM-dependent methyltransferase
MVTKEQAKAMAQLINYRQLGRGVSPTSCEGKFECNICGNKSDIFLSDNWHEQIICPYCFSDVRHRLEYAVFQFLKNYSIEALFQDKYILHFAAEKQIAANLKRFALKYISADIKTGIDMTNMPQYNNETFDVVIANDVLEHIVDLSKGLEEVHRVLKHGGFLICTVPQKDDLKETQEDPAINTPELRERHYGQHDHVRLFGNDFQEIVEKFGFSVDVIDRNYFPKEIVEKHVLFPPKLSTKCNATNYRKIYMCIKQGTVYNVSS